VLEGHVRQGPSNRQDRWLAAVLFLMTLLSRLPFRARILYHWDSVNFAYAMREFDVAKEQPQPPGYILYVWLCRLVDGLIDQAPLTMTIISIVASALAVAALFYLGRAIFNRWVGCVAALFLAVSPLFWFYGEIALPHTLDALLVILSVWWLYETMRGRTRFLLPAVLILAIAGGVRQQTLVFLAPLALFSLRRVGWRRFAVAAGVGALLCATWFVPLMLLSGGIGPYMATMSSFAARFQVTTSILMGAGSPGIRYNLTKLGKYTLYGWAGPIASIAAYAIWKMRHRALAVNWEKCVFLVLWTAPSAVFYALIHMGQQGLIFVFLPVLLLLSAQAVAVMTVGHSRWRTLLPALMASSNAALFLLAPEYPAGPRASRLLTRATLANSDAYYEDRFALIRDHFQPPTVVLAANWHHVEYYLPEYTVLRLDAVTGSQAGSLACSEHVLDPRDGSPVHVILFDTGLQDLCQSNRGPRELPLSHGGTLSYYSLGVGETLQ
jgi:hypothetical protein